MLPGETIENREQIVQSFEDAWDSRKPPDIESFVKGISSERRWVVLELVHSDLELRLKNGLDVRVESYLERFPELENDPEQVVQLVASEYRIRRRLESDLDDQEYASRFPNLYKRLLAEMRRTEDMDAAVGIDSKEGEASVTIDANAGIDSHADTSISRYKIESTLGEGGFGTVYLAEDSTLHRKVAIKVPRRDEFDAERFVAEAQKSAHLDHPSIVPVYDVGQREDGKCYVVSKYIEGQSLKQLLSTGDLPVLTSIKIVADIAEALHYAHTRGIYHRDVKPGNILVDRDQQAYLTDFGLAISESQVGLGPTFAGTLAYMSPEQARDESHLVDGRSDVFSLGVVLYHLLTGQLPFQGDTFQTVRDRIRSGRFRPMRQCDSSIDVELEKITSTAMQLDLNARYSTAHDMARDLRAYLNVKQRKPRKVNRLANSWARWVVLAIVLSVILVFLFFSRRTDSTVVVDAKHQEVVASLFRDSPPKPADDTTLPPFGIRIQRANDGMSVPNGDELSSGDLYQISALVTDECYLYVFQLDTAGQLHWLYPENDTCAFSFGTNPLPSGTHSEIRLPGNGEYFELDRSTGKEFVFCVASTTRWIHLEEQTTRWNHPEEQLSTTNVGSPSQRVKMRYQDRGIAGTKPHTVTRVEGSKQHYSLVNSSSHFAIIHRWFFHR